MAELRFGIFDWIDKNESLSVAETYEQRLKMLELADEAGIWCYHVAEHHGTPLAVAPSPNLFLTAVAERTERLRFGPLVQLLPLYNPLRNIEEVCFLDNISGGRLELGVGRGVSPEELAVYGVDIAESRDMFDESFEILLQGLRTGSVTHHGKHYQIDGAPLPIEPLQKPYPPLWYPTSSAERIDWVASHGFNTLLGFTRTGLDVIAAGVQRYREQYERHAGDPDRYNGHVDEPMLGATRHVFVAEDASEAEEVARKAYSDFDHNFLIRPGKVDAESRRGDYDTAVDWGGIIVGTPDQVREQVQAFVDTTGANYFVGSFAFGSLTTEHLLNSLRLFTREVMPAIRPATVGQSAGA